MGARVVGYRPGAKRPFARARPQKSRMRIATRQSVSSRRCASSRLFAWLGRQPVRLLRGRRPGPGPNGPGSVPRTTAPVPPGRSPLGSRRVVCAARLAGSLMSYPRSPLRPRRRRRPRRAGRRTDAAPPPTAGTHEGPCLARPLSLAGASDARGGAEGVMASAGPSARHAPQRARHSAMLPARAHLPLRRPSPRAPGVSQVFPSASFVSRAVSAKSLGLLVLPRGLEPPTPSLPRTCSTN